MRNVWDLTAEEAAEQALNSDPETRVADELVAQLFSEQAFLIEASNDEIRNTFPPDEAATILAYRLQQDSSQSDLGDFDTRLVASSGLVASIWLAFPNAVPQTMPRAEGGYTSNHVVRIGDGYISLIARWTRQSLSLSWEHVALPASSYILGVFRATTDDSLLTRPYVLGRLDAGDWNALAEDLGFDLDQPWLLQIVVISDIEQ